MYGKSICWLRENFHAVSMVKGKFLYYLTVPHLKTIPYQQVSKYFSICLISFYGMIVAEKLKSGSRLALYGPDCFNQQDHGNQQFMQQCSRQ